VRVGAAEDLPDQHARLGEVGAIGGAAGDLVCAIRPDGAFPDPLVVRFVLSHALLFPLRSVGLEPMPAARAASLPASTADLMRRCQSYGLAAILQGSGHGTTTERVVRHADRLSWKVRYSTTRQNPRIGLLPHAPKRRVASDRKLGPGPGRACGSPEGSAWRMATRSGPR